MTTKKPTFTVQELLEAAKKAGHDMFYDGEFDDDHGIHGCAGEACTVPWHKELRDKLAKERADAALRVARTSVPEGEE